MTTRKHHWSNQNRVSLARSPIRYPRGVPWDQNLWSKKFLIQPLNDVYLWDFLIVQLKIKVYLLIWDFYPYNIGLLQKFAPRSLNKLWFSAKKSKNLINTYHSRVVWEIFWTKNFGPMGHPWGTWWASWPRTCVSDLTNSVFWQSLWSRNMPG